MPEANQPLKIMPEAVPTLSPCARLLFLVGAQLNYKYKTHCMGKEAIYIAMTGMVIFVSLIVLMAELCEQDTIVFYKTNA